MKFLTNFFPDTLIGLLIVLNIVQYLNIRILSKHKKLLKNNLRILEENKINIRSKTENIVSSVNEISVVDPITIK